MTQRIKSIGIAVITAITTVGLLGINSFVSATVPGTNQRVSLTSTGGQTNGDSLSSLISSNGEVVAFYSGATNILSSGGAGLFARNLKSGAVSRINASTAGTVANSSTNLLKISATGRYALFSSNFASNLIDGTTTPTTYPQMYLRDINGSTTTLVSQTPTGTLSNGSYIDALGVSSDGRFIAYTTNASNLHADSTDGTPHLYVLDRRDNTISIVDRKTDGTVGTTNSSWAPQGAMSCDGSFLAFTYPSNMIVGDTNSNHVDVYLLDRRGVTDRLTNLTKTANAAAMGASISCNGDYVGFKSLAQNIDSSITVNNVYNAYRPYIYDRVNGTYRFAAVTNSGTATDAAICGMTLANVPCIQISDTGLGVFSANDSTLTGNSGNQVYIRDIYAGTTELISKNSSGIASGSYSLSTNSITADGNVVSHSSDASNLVSGDTNGRWDVFTSLTGY